VCAVTLALYGGLGWGQETPYAAYLDKGTYHIGDDDYGATTDLEIVAQNQVVGPKWSIPFSVQKTVWVRVGIDMLYGVGGRPQPPDTRFGVVTVGDQQAGFILA